jgi:hypothetical protein
VEANSIDVAPDGAGELFLEDFYKYDAPSAIAQGYRETSRCQGVTPACATSSCFGDIAHLGFKN